MICQRGYTIDEDYRVQDSESFFLRRLHSDLILDAHRGVVQVQKTKVASKNDRVLVWWPKQLKGERIGVGHIETYVKQMTKLDQATHAIVITSGMTHFAKRRMSQCEHKQKIQKQKIFNPLTNPTQFILDQGVLEFEHFLSSQLLFNLTKHSLYVPHLLLTEEETDELFSKFHCTKQRLPLIFSADPVVRFFNFPKGSVLKIERNLGSLSSQFMYRLVVE